MSLDHVIVQKPPAGLGFSLPAEWERHEATWIVWPHNRSDWQEKFDLIPRVYSQIVKKITPSEIVRILVNSEMYEAQARRLLASIGTDMTQVEFFHFPTNRGWTRDFGPIFVRRYYPRPEVAIVRFRFNGWARYSDWQKDDAIPLHIGEAIHCPLFEARINDADIVLEGGAIDVNGSGSAMTTEECLLDKEVQVRNPSLNLEEMERAIRENLGITNLLWLGRGIAGDDTHGHIDDFCRFVGPRTVVLCQERDSNDINHRILEENRERLEGMRLEDGSAIEVVRLPMPMPLWLDGERLPASYANFYISNAGVLVPTFNDVNDRLALGILADLFTDRPVVGIHAGDLVWGLGTLHCVTQQQPSLCFAVQQFSE